MSVSLGYLLPTRENILNNQPEGRHLMEAARMAADLGVDSLWAGDSLLARPRHDPLTLLAAVAGAIPKVQVGTAVLLPVLRNPVILAQQLATLDQISDGRFIAGVGIAADNPAIRNEFTAAGVPFERRVGRLLETVRLWRALWRGEAVQWDGRWQVNGALAPQPSSPDGPQLWLGTGTEAGIQRTAKHFDGWFPIGPDLAGFSRGQQRYEQALATEPSQRTSTTAIYLTVCVMDDTETAAAAIDDYLENYYNMPAHIMRRFQACHGGTLESTFEFINGFVNAGANHVVLRLVGDHKATLQKLSRQRDELLTS